MRVGLIGAGWIAAEQHATLGRLADVEVVAVCDVDVGRALELAGEASVYTYWRELLDRDGPDAVFVCTHPRAHREPAVAALERGINVYLEKPIARGVDDAQAIVEAAGQSQAVCAVGYQWRAVDVLPDLHRAIEGQEVGL